MTLKIGIDKISFYTPHLYVDMVDLANARGVDPGKFTIGIGQSEMAVAPLTQDPVTLAANAAKQIIDDSDREAIDFVMFATESGIDQSKSAGVYVHELLGLNKNARSIELKQACYSATAALQLAKGHVLQHPDRKVLVLASDIARYGLSTSGEVTQGAGAVAMIVSQSPRLLTIEDESTYLTNDIMDFWRPTYSEMAYVDGKFSNEQYLEFFQTVWSDFKSQANVTLDDFSAMCFHIPYTKMGLKALRLILEEGTEETQTRLKDHFEESIKYSRRVGNIYSASLYLGLVSLIENAALHAGDRVGLFSYGSGAVGEFFQMTVADDFKSVLQSSQHNALLDQRKKLSIPEYEETFLARLPEDGSKIELDASTDPADIYLAGIDSHMRQYKVK